MNTINVENCKTLLIGRRGENEVTTVSFDFTEWASEFGSGVVDLYVKRFGDDSAYPVVLTIDGTVASWLVTETDTNVAGYGKAEYVYRVDGKIAKSAVFPFFVAEDIGQPAIEPPDPYESWLEQLTALGAETEAHAQAAEQSAENAAESAEDAAQSAASAEGYAGQAETAAGLAQAAQTASEAARDAAQTAQASAEASATAASGSAASAASSATAAAGSAFDASASATAAGASATTASTAAGQAEAAKTAAQTAQSAAEDAAVDAQQAAQQAHVEYEQLSGEVDDLSDEVSQQKSAIDDLTALTNRKAGMLVDSVSGAIASFVPDSTIPDLLGVSVAVEPVQDLHGYDAPWPGGGGKNKLPSANSISPPSSLTVTNENGQYVLNGSVASGDSIYFRYDTITIENGFVFACGNSFVKSILYFLNGTTQVDYFTLSPVNRVINASQMSTLYGKPFASIRIRFSEDQTFTNAIFSPMVVIDGADTTTFAPYENICPISGWDAVEVERTGINVWDAQWEGGYYDISDGSAKASSSWQRSKNDIVCKPNTAYCARQETARASLGYFLFYKEDGEYISSLTMTGNVPTIGQTFSTPSECRIIRIYRAVQNDGLGFSINYPSTDNAYHPYAGNSYTIALGQTVYGGTLDVTAGTLTVDRAMVTLDNASLLYQDGDSISYRQDFSNRKLFPNSTTGLMCSAFIASVDASPAVRWRGATQYRLTFLGTTVDTLTNLISAGQLSISYLLATPIEIQLEPVTIATIASQTSNVWADAGDVTVEFAADLKHYIDSKIAAAVAALS